MNSLFANRVTNAPRSFTRKILDVIGKADIISFAGGLPDASLFPHELIKEKSSELFDTSTLNMYQYSNANGAASLREALAREYTHTEPEEILITTGSQQGLDLLCKAFINPKDTIIVEAPSYLAALNLFALYDANIKEVPLTCKGVDTLKLEELFQRYKPKFFYTIPTFQNPTGWSWDESCKYEVARLAEKYGVIIIEDAPYNALRYEGEEELSFEEILPLMSVHLGTFSKTLVPDFRLGWMRAKKEFIKVFLSLKEATDLQSSKFFQEVTAKLISSGDLKKHIATLQDTYRVKKELMSTTLQKLFQEEITFEKPQGGMFLWVDFGGDIDTMKLFNFAIQEGVAFVPGEVFFQRKEPSSYARLNFTNANALEIQEGLERLKRAHGKYLANSDVLQTERVH